MKALLLISSVFLLSTSLLAAQISDEVKKIVDSFPKKIGSTTSLALEINEKFKSEEEKVGAIYYWIANNITFDIKEHFSDKKKVTYNFKYKSQAEKEEKIEKVNREIAEKAFNSRKAVAKEYAFLFKKLCVNSGIECITIYGTSKSGLKDIGRNAGRINHHWNAVKINGKWWQVDVVWGAGELYEDTEFYIRIYNEAYFLIEPELFYLNHYPKKLEWLFLEKTKEDFGMLPLFYKPYLKSNLLLMSPDGVIDSAPGDKLKIIFTYRDNQKKRQPYIFSYAFERGASKKALMPKQEGGKLLTEVSLADVKSDYLTIYIDNRPLVSFKIKISRY